MNQPQAISMLFLSIIIIIFLDDVTAQSPPPPPLYTTNDLFKPTLVITTGVFSVVFTLTFVLLVYAKCFHYNLRPETNQEGDIGRLDRLWQGLFDQSSRLSSSGLNKTAIESLPFFRFSALKGSKQGLDCSVCLSRFQDVEILRLLPKCKHAFHIECIDEWLEKHATCPLCRNRVSIEDELSVLSCSSNNNSMRIMSQEATEEEIYIEREEGEEASDGSSRFSSFRKILKFGKNDKTMLLVEQGNEKRLHKFRHRIVVSDAVFKNRWSNVTPSDLTRLTSNMLGSMSSERFSSMERVQRGDLRDKEDIDMKNKDSTRRAVSEITAVPRLSVMDENAVGGSDSGLVASTSRSDATEERRRQLWLPIARKTAHWFVNRETRNDLNTTPQQS